MEPGVEDAAALPEQEGISPEEIKSSLTKGPKVIKSSPKGERVAFDYAQDVAAKNRSEVKLEADDIISTPDKKTAYNLAGGLRKRGHKNVGVNETDTGFEVFFDPDRKDDTIDYSLDEGIERDEAGTPVRQKQIDNYIQDIKDNPGFDADYYRQNYADDSLTAEEAEFAEDQALGEGPEFSTSEDFVSPDQEKKYWEVYDKVYDKAYEEAGRPEQDSEAEFDIVQEATLAAEKAVGLDSSPEFSLEEGPTNFRRHQDLSQVAGNRVQLNIGLENNPYSYEGLIAKLAKNPKVRLGTTEQVTGEYEGKPERTLVVNAKYDGPAKEFRQLIEKLNEDATQEAIGVRFNGRGSLIYDPKFEGDKYTFDPEFFINPSNQKSERAGALDSEGLAAQGIDEADLFEKAGEGQSYTVAPFERKGAVVDADKSIGGKGGFASSGDARESITAIGRGANEIDALKLAEALVASQRYMTPAQITGLASEAGSTIPAFSKIRYESSGKVLNEESLVKMRDRIDKIAGYKGAHLQENPKKVSVVNTLNLPTAKKPTRKLGPQEGTQVRPERELGVVTPTDHRGRFGRPKSVIDRITQDKSLEPGIVLGKDVKEKEGTEAFDPSFDRSEVAGPSTRDIRKDLGKQPKIDKNLLDKYNNNEISDNDLIKSLTNYVLNQVPLKSGRPDTQLQGFALERLSDQVAKGNFKNKSPKQVFSKAKGIAKSARGLQHEAYGTSKDAVTERNRIRRGLDRFQAEFGYEPSLDELAEYVNELHGTNLTGLNVEQALTDEISTELPGVQGEARDRAQTRIAREAGLDQLTDAVIGPRIADKIDKSVQAILAKSPEYPSGPEFAGQSPRRGAGFKTKGDKAATKIKKEGTKLDQDIAAGISNYIGRDNLIEAFPILKDLFNLDANSFDDLSRAQKQDLKRKVVKGLATEAEARLGKTPGLETPSPEFSLSERQTREEQQASSVIDTHGDSTEAAVNKVKDAISKLKEPNDYIVLIDGKVSRSQPAVNEAIKSAGLKVRQARLGNKTNLGRRIIYHPSAIANYNLAESDVHTTRPDPGFLNRVVDALNKAWPNNKIYGTQAAWSRKIQELAKNGYKVPNRLKGMMIGGQVWLNPSALTYDTPIHEFAHIWAKQLIRENPMLWLKGKELLKGSKYHKAVHANPTYRAYLKNEPSRYWEEVMANAIGKKGAEIFANQKDASKWDKWMKKAGDWIKSKLGIGSNKSFNDLTLNDWLDTAVHGVFTGTTPSPTERVEFSAAEEPTFESDVAAARLAGKRAEGKWYKKPLKWLIPPASEDYHGLVRDLKVKGVKALTDIFVNNHHDYVNKATKVRSAVARASKGINLNQKNVVTYKGNKLSAAQAIQAHVNGFPNEFSKRPKIQKYIDTMTKLGVLKENDGYDTASPQADLVNYIVNDLYAESFKDFNNKKSEVFSPEVMERLLAEKGQKYVDALQSALGRMSTGKNPGFSSKIGQKWNDWVLGSVGVTMFLNFRSAALQMLSVGNYGFHSKSPGAFFAAFANPETYAEAKKLFNDPYLKERRARAGFDVNATEMMTLLENSNSFSDFTKKVLNKGFIATSAVDSMAIALGGAAFIKSQIKAGVSPEAAKKQWKEQTEKAQQSSRPDRVSQWQTEGVSKYVLAFANTPQQYFRLSRKALREIKAGRNVKANLARIGYYMAVQNAIFTSLQSASLALLNGLGDEEEKEEEANIINSMLDTVLRGMGIYGAVASTIKNVAFEGWKQEQKPRPDHVATALKASTISPPINRKINDLLSIGRGYNYDSDDKHINALARGTAFTTNLPADWIHKKVKAVGNLQAEQYSNFEKLLMLMGWSEYNFKDNETSDLDFGDFDDFDFDFDDEDLDFS